MSEATKNETFLIVGLGNPGAEYASTRHNAGFLAVDALAADLRVSYWKTECGAVTGKVAWRGRQLVLAKPQSFMNCSGGPVKQLLRAYGVGPEQLIVVHDDLDIAPGRIRVKFGGGHAGHNGLRSIIDKTGTRDWLRVRIGIGRPPEFMDTASYVLAAPKKEAADCFSEGIATAAKAVLSLIEDGLEKTQQAFN